ncbi:response regulator transcription factor [Aequorivita sp. KMM 9714]|uniref:response regulator n=1 Tax=Aequorivita sp. KMM 9714 TaxID=2707173 RepID=UPI0013EBB3AC|nr:response regulator transcription factor [Aequorivita sp. KMM 9714]NGX82981.1 response regulator transcription factor [Aequorivita sp. KMM 9714]
MIVKSNVTFVIADDHPMILKGLNDELTSNNYNVVGKAINGLQALEHILTYKPTIALLDIDMPLLTGFEVIKMAKEKEVDTKFIVLSFHKESDYISQAKSLQINGYLLKEDSFSEIEKCISNVIQGKTYFSKSFEPSSLQTVSDDLKKIKLLTASEKTILKLIAKQLSTAEIADNLCVSPRTVEKHRSNILSKLELNGTNHSLSNWALIHKKAIREI